MLGFGQRHLTASAYRPALETLEDRCLLAIPVIDPIVNTTGNIPAGKTLIVPVTATADPGTVLTYSATSSNPAITATVHTGNPYLQINVQGFGTMTFQLLSDVAPNTVARIEDLVNSGFYNGKEFYRVAKDFVIQAGNITGFGTPFDDEFNASAIFSGSGQLAMANAGPDDNTSEFFVTVGAPRFLDFNHTIFGQLVRGFDVLQAINQVATTPVGDGQPNIPVVITSASIIADTTDAVLTLQAANSTLLPTTTITVTASDGAGHTAMQTFSAQAVADTRNDPPILGPIDNQVTPVNRPLTFTLSATDLENDPLQFEAILQGDSANHASVAVSGNTVTVTPNAGFMGLLDLLVGVKDQGATDRGTPGSDPFDTQHITVNVVVSFNQRYVTQLYHDLLRRAPDAGGLNAFTGVLDSGRFTMAQVVNAIQTSVEHRQLQVQDLYQQLLQRPADAGGLTLYTHFLQAGRSLQELRAIFVSSPEYSLRRAGSSDAGFLAALYQDALGRGIDAGTAAADMAALAHVRPRRRAALRQRLTKQVFGSLEEQIRLTEGFYQKLLQRVADPRGLKAFTTALGAGMSEDLAQASMLLSPEYMGRV
jgi:cyclophilin family peptidyl-prolyl cis-trans isomerase